MLVQRIATAATAGTCALMFAVMGFLSPVVAALSTKYAILSVVAAIITSAGAYKLLSMGLLWLLNSSVKLRQWVLGEAFIEGTWVGRYGQGKLVTYTVEFISQKSGQTVIQGAGFDADGEARGAWESIAVEIDEKRGKLIYVYECRMNDRSTSHHGVSIFQIVREGGGPATVLRGYASDVTDGVKDTNVERKIAVTEIAQQDALAKARSLFPPDRSHTALLGTTSDALVEHTPAT